MAPKRKADESSKRQSAKKKKTRDASTPQGPKGKGDGAERAADARDSPKPKANSFKLPKDAIDSCEAITDQMKIDVVCPTS